MQPSSDTSDAQEDGNLGSNSHSQSLPPPQCQRHPNNTSASPAPLSKNAMKKAIKAERYASAKLERRAREKEKKKEKKRQKALEKTAELGEGSEVDQEGANRGKKRARTDGDGGKRRAAGKVIQFGGRVVIDLGFDDLMNEKEIVSLTSQLAYTYSLNRRASFPFSLIFTSLNGRTFTRLETLGDYKRWANTVWWEEGYERLWLGGSGTVDDQPSGDKDDLKEPQENVAYLTADSDEELLELKPDETYIIGGIVDHNRYKNLCLNKAMSASIRTARLPIGRYLADMQTRKVLTVNQVFDIMLQWVETKDWEQALYAVVPKRKFQRADNGFIGEELVLAELEEAPDGAELDTVGTDEASNSSQLQEVEAAGSAASEVMVNKSP